MRVGMYEYYSQIKDPITKLNAHATAPLSISLSFSHFLSLSLSLSLSVYIYIYIYIEREREKRCAWWNGFYRENGHGDPSSKPGRGCLHFT